MALHEAVGQGHVRYVELLLSHGAHPVVPSVSLAVQAGVAGFIANPMDDGSPAICFHASWIEKRGYEGANSLAIKITGASMEDSLFDGDKVVVHVADNKPRDGEVFAVNYEGEVLVRRMKRERGAWWMASDNQDKRRFPEKEFAAGVSMIIGRVAHMQSERI